MHYIIGLSCFEGGISWPMKNAKLKLSMKDISVSLPAKVFSKRLKD
jgi:hypothetical protein